MVFRSGWGKVRKLMALVGKLFYAMALYKTKIINIYLKDVYYQKIKKIGVCVRIHGVSYIRSIENVEIGNNVHIAENAYIVADGGLIIGDNVHISRNVVIYTSSHNYEGKYLPYDNSMRMRKVVIEKNVWIGMNVVVLPGSHIKEGAIVGAGAVVGGNVEKLSIYGASLGSVISKRDDAHYFELDSKSMYGARNGVNLKSDCDEM
jgi:maltose O-acetyltransferase